MEATALINSFRNYLYNTSLGCDISKIILFGSQAKGTAHDDSDYDFLIVLKINDYDWKYSRDFSDVIYKFELENDVFIDEHLISEHELKHTLRGQQPIFRNALKYGLTA